MTTIFNLDPSFQRKLIQGFKDSVVAIEGQTKTEITSPKWDYPRETKRKNGQVVSTPRDIVDTGELRNSLYSEMRGERNAVIGTKAEHSQLVHNGYFTSTGKEVPPRPYLKTGFTEADRLGLIQESFDKAVR